MEASGFPPITFAFHDKASRPMLTAGLLPATPTPRL